MENVIRYLIENPEVVGKLKMGLVSLLGVDEEEVSAIIHSFEQMKFYSYYWR